jgi:uncharacterized protein (TIGR02145 family)
MDICNYPKRDLFIRVGLKYPCAGYYLRWYYNGWHYWHFLPGEQYVLTEGENYRTIGRKRIILGTGNITLDQVTAIRTLLLTKEIQIYTESGWVNVYIEPSSMVIYDNEVNGYEVELTITIGSKEISYLSGYSPVEYVPVVDPAPDPAICEIIIGSQIWMCKNYASAFPGSKVYNNDEANRDVYGGLYTWDQIMTPGFCPVNWKIPTEAEFQTLITFLGGAAVAGGHLKEAGTGHWDAPNTGADDSSGFAARGAGYWNYLFNSFLGLKQNTRFWTSTEKSATNAATALLNFDSAAISLGSSYKGWGFSVRLLKTSKPPARDYDGNDYNTVIIGTQEWFVENLKTTHYRNGSAIPNITDDLLWGADVNGAYCWYDNDISNKNPYGALYNYYAVDNINGLAPAGWRIPTYADLNTLRTYLGGMLIAGGKLKETGIIHWNAPNAGATNETGFTLLAAGLREQPLLWVFIDMLSYGYIATSNYVAPAWQAFLGLYDTAMFLDAGFGRSEGLSVRCMRDV